MLIREKCFFTFIFISYDYDDWDNPLIIAIKQKSLELVDLLVTNGASLDYIHDDTQPDLCPLIIAIKIDALEIAKYLISKGADANDVASNASIFSPEYELEDPLIVAIKRKNMNMINFLLENGYELQKNVFLRGFLIVKAAIDSNLYEIIQLLFDNGLRYQTYILDYAIDKEKSEEMIGFLKKFENPYPENKRLMKI